MSKWIIVVPTNRPDRFKKWLEAWEPVLPEGYGIISIFDGDAVASWPHEDWPSYDWNDIPDWIPRKSDMIRSWGIYQAWKTDCDYALSLDDDCMPTEGFFEAYERVFERGAPCSPYFDVGAMTNFDGQMRGFPFGDRKREDVPIQYGGWNGVLDFDAVTQIGLGGPGYHFFNGSVVPVPKGAAVTCCAMNMAWQREFSPIMWQLPLFEGRYNRFGDIWSGLIQKKVLDAMGLPMVINGKARVIHERASDPLTNIVRESPGIPHNEKLWWAMEELEGENMMDLWFSATHAVWRYFAANDKPYADQFMRARNSWAALFS